MLHEPLHRPGSLVQLFEHTCGVKGPSRKEYIGRIIALGLLGIAPFL